MDPDAITNLSGQASKLEIEGAPRGPGPLSGFEVEAPPAPKIHSNGIVATDITAFFKSAAAQLPVGTLVKDDFFTLFESVGAVELMDPKMDTGFVADGDTLEDDYDISKALLPEEVLGIIDQLLCLEMAWHMGHPLSQTIFTSLHIDHLYSCGSPDIVQPTFGSSDSGSDGSVWLQALRAYSLGLLKSCSHVNNRVKSEHYYEEEDFVSHTYSRNLLDNVEDLNLLEYIDDTRKLVSEQNDIGSSLQDALVARLAFRRSFLNVVSQADDRASTVLQDLWEVLKRGVQGLKVGHELGKPVLESFSTKLQRKLASTVPPRPVVTISYQAAYKHLEHLCADGQIILEVLDYHESQNLITFVSLFQSRKPQPSVYIRTLLQHYLFGDMMMLGKLSIRDVLDDDLESIILVQHTLVDRLNDEIELPHDSRFFMAQKMELFRQRAAQSWLDILRTLCQNRPRIRRTLHHAISDWDNLQFESEDLDVELQQYTGEIPVNDSNFSPEPQYCYPLSSWSYYYKLRCMELSVHLGFELTVFQPWELAGMYWYLQHLSMTRLRHLERMRKFVMNRFSQHRNASKLPPGQADLDYARSLSFLNFSMLEATAITGFASAISALYAILLRLEAIPSPELPFSSPAIRYELRMKPFFNISLPPLVPHAEFQDEVSFAGEDIQTMLEFAKDAAGRAKKDWELLSKLDAGTARCKGAFAENAWRANLKDCLRATIMVGIGIAAVAKGVEKYGDGKGVGKKFKVEVPEEGKRYHEWWVVPKVSVE